MKKIISLLALLSLVSCFRQPVPIDYSVGIHYVGSVWVEYNGESYENKDIDVSFTLSDDGKSAEIQINRIRFVPQMPVTVDTVLPASVTKSGETYTFTADDVFPHSPAGAEQNKYKINKLSGMVTGQMLSFSLFFGAYPTSFTGQRLAL